MKNIKNLFLAILIVFVSLFTINAKASSVPYLWEVNGEEINTNHSTDYARLEKDGKVVTLYLTNYNGAGIKLKCYGTGQSDMTFIIVLTGENYITDENIGVDLGTELSKYKIDFRGEGTLSIKAPKPISNESYENTMIIKPAQNVYTDVEEETKPETTETVGEANEDDKEEVTTSEDTVETISAESKDSNLVLYIIFGAYVVLSLGIILLLITKLPKNKATN